MPDISLTITVPAAHASRIVAAVEGQLGRLPGETSRDMAERHIQNWLKSVVKSWEGETAAQSARRTVEQDVQDNVNFP